MKWREHDVDVGMYHGHKVEVKGSEEICNECES